MDQDVYEMVMPGNHPKKLHVEHMGKPCQRMPVCRIPYIECPQETMPGQSAGNLDIFTHVDGIVVMQESMAQGWGIDSQVEHDYGQRYQKHALK